MTINADDVRRQRKQHERKFEPTHDDGWGTIAEVDGSVHPPGRNNQTWVNMFNLGASVVAVWNDTTLRKPGTPVQLGNDPKPPGLRVTGTYTKALTPINTVDLSRFNTPPHAQSHQYLSENQFGDDVAKIYQPALQLLKTTANGVDLTIRTEPLIYNFNGVRKVFPGAFTDLTSDVPGTAGHIRRVLVYLDMAANTITTIQGTSVLNNGVIPIPYPELPEASRASAYVKLANGQTSANTPDHVEDSRDFLAGAQETLLEDLIDVTFTDLADGDTLVYDADENEWVNGTGGGGAGELDDLSDVTITSLLNGQILLSSGGVFENVDPPFVYRAGDVMTGALWIDEQELKVLSATGDLFTVAPSTDLVTINGALIINGADGATGTTLAVVAPAESIEDSGIVVGVELQPTLAGTHADNYFVGVRIRPTAEMAPASGTSTVVNFMDVFPIFNGIGTFDAVAGTRYSLSVNSGTIGQVRGLDVLVQGSGATVTDLYGLYVSVSPLATNNYAIFTERGHVVLNDFGEAYSVRIKGDNDASLLYVAGATDQVAIGTDTPVTDAKFEVAGTDGAFLLPRLTSTERDALTKTDGMEIYNVTVDKVQAVEDDAWVTLSDGGSGSPGGSDGQVQYNNGGVFGGAGGLVWDDVNNRLGVGIAAPAAKASVREDENTTLTVFTQAADKAGLLIHSDYTADAYTPGLYWVTDDNNPTKPKAGIFLQVTGTGSRLLLGTSNSYTTGITNQGLIINQSGQVAIGNVSVTGGVITGITDLAVADGGTGASDASGARTNLGLVAGGTGDIWVEKAGDDMTGLLTVTRTADGATDYALSATRSGANTSGTLDLARFDRIVTGGDGANGIGSYVWFGLENTSGTLKDAMYIQTRLTTATNGAEVARADFGLISGGAFGTAPLTISGVGGGRVGIMKDPTSLARTLQVGGDVLIDAGGTVQYRIESGGTFKAALLYDSSADDVRMFSSASGSVPRFNFTAGGNVALMAIGSFGGGVGVLFLPNRTTAPTTNPSGGGLLYVQAGALRYRGSSGTDVQIAAA